MSPKLDKRPAIFRTILTSFRLGSSRNRIVPEVKPLKNRNFRHYCKKFNGRPLRMYLLCILKPETQRSYFSPLQEPGCYPWVSHFELLWFGRFSFHFHYYKHVKFTTALRTSLLLQGSSFIECLTTYRELPRWWGTTTLSSPLESEKSEIQHFGDNIEPFSVKWCALTLGA